MLKFAAGFATCWALEFVLAKNRKRIGKAITNLGAMIRLKGDILRHDNPIEPEDFSDGLG